MTFWSALGGDGSAEGLVFLRAGVGSGATVSEAWGGGLQGHARGATRLDARGARQLSHRNGLLLRFCRRIGLAAHDHAGQRFSGLRRQARQRDPHGAGDGAAVLVPQQDAHGPLAQTQGHQGDIVDVQANASQGGSAVIRIRDRSDEDAPVLGGPRDDGRGI